MNNPQSTLERRMDNGDLLKLSWLRDGSLAIERYTIAHLADGHGYLQSGTCTIEAEQARAFAAAGSPIIQTALVLERRG